MGAKGNHRQKNGTQMTQMTLIFAVKILIPVYQPNQRYLRAILSASCHSRLWYVK
jgi:hypothetical protein